MIPKHKKASYFHAKDLFADLSSFRELENRIVNLPEVERGDAFEVFAEAYLSTQPIHEVEEIWPEKSLPQSLRELLNIPSDAGIDGVFKTNTGHYKAYQVKFRSSRGPLSWGGDSLGNFFGQADRVSGRVLFTNSVDLTDLATSRVNFYSIKGNELDCLEPSSFKVIEDWLKTGIVQRERLEPKEHQRQAIDAIVSEFSEKDRTTAIMACGTGKTLVALKVAEKLEAETILVLLPSLALIRQTLHDWAHNHGWTNFNFLCVCSDHTVVSDEGETILFQRDLDFAVTTQPEEIAAFLNNGNVAPKIIFSTYQSCRMVAQAMPGNFAFDLAIFDEAHKTASRLATNHAFALSENNIAIKKRLFLTATPRHYNIDVKDKFGDNQLVFSMDDETIYGRVAYKLSFRAAVKEGLICDYKVLISVITSDMLNRELLKRGEVLVDGDIIKAQRIANILAIQNAVEQFGVKRIFSFHSSISAAKSFTTKTNEGVGAYLTDFKTMHVSGEMSSSKRDAILTEFRDAEKALISNARCLTEGVNVPAVDMVAFVSPKKSKVDIAQAAGRAMRKHPGKERGYILVPLFMQDAEQGGLDQALTKTKFDTLWDVLQAMQEQDENLVEIIAQLRENRGRSLGINDNRLRDHVEVLGPELFYNELRKAITTRIIDRLGSTWDERFGELCKFKEVNSHCNISRDSSLGSWVIFQRVQYKKGKLSPERIIKLEKINFDWNPIDNQWKNNFLELCQVKEQLGHCNIPKDYIDNPSLGSWVDSQRQNKKMGILPHYCLEQLNSIDFDWNPNDTRWEKMCLLLIEFYNEFSNCDVPSTYKNKQLSTWVTRQRTLYGQNKLVKNRFHKLKNLGFVFEPDKSAWEEMFLELSRFKEENGHCNVPQKYLKCPKLGSWVATQRALHKKRHLSLIRVDRLTNIGFAWKINVDNHKSVDWDDNFLRLYSYKKKFGHINVQVNSDEYRQLYIWIIKQRDKYRKNNLSEERTNKLNTLGFDWNPNSQNKENWDANFDQLALYHNWHGHCNVPNNLENKKLGSWVSKQRDKYRKNNLSEERTNKLNVLGFDWNPADKQIGNWNANFAQLISYKNLYNNANVPKNYPRNKQLGIWVDTQRQKYKKGNLSQGNIDKLNSINFDWDPKNTYWEVMFGKLCRFRLKTGNCNISRKNQDRELANWVNNQRSLYRNKQLTPKRIRALLSVDFVFGPDNDNWQDMFSALCHYKVLKGNCQVPQKYAGNLALGRWVSRQKTAYNNRALSDEKFKKLNDIGFTWPTIKINRGKLVPWEDRFLQLCKFKELHGDCNVPKNYPENQQLERWVRSQKENYKKGNLPSIKIDLLDSIGFIWALKKDK